MSFEMMLAQLMNLPVKFFLSEAIDINKAYLGKEMTDELSASKKRDKRKVIDKFDQEMKQIKVPKILLERLKKEFDDSHSLSTQFGKPSMRDWDNFPAGAILKVNF